MRKRIFLPLFIGFFAGFLVHALFFPDLLANGIVFLPNLDEAKKQQPPPSALELTPLTTIITFDGQTFNRHNVRVGKTRYIAIQNTSDEQLMWLVSSEKLLTTPRGYATGEALRVQLNQAGQFIVSEKNTPSEKLVITVQ